MSSLVVFSGGQDSTTCALWAKVNLPGELHAITFSYNQRHAIELDRSKEIGRRLGFTSHETVVLPRFFGSSPLVDHSLDVPAVSAVSAALQATFVPGRNLTFLSLAAGYAMLKGATELVTGICEAESGNYPDCTIRFRDAAEAAISVAMGTVFRIHAPLINKTKAESVLMMEKLGGLHLLANTHTCYRGSFPPCLRCHACVLRAKGFSEAKIADPLILRCLAAGSLNLTECSTYGVPVK